MKNLRFLALLLFVAIKQGKSDIKCELKSGVNSALNKVGSAALRGLYYHNNRNSKSPSKFENDVVAPFSNR